ncbi:MAG: hypothetical protein IT444_09055 [Phycisphaeraceae bacterium]|nr:hypothetical protein [Phycisphaeraceae bacterium]
MTRRWHQIIHAVQLLRLEVVFSAISNAWLVVFLAWQNEPGSAGQHTPGFQSLEFALVLTLVVAGGLAIYGIALNDVLDVRHDRTFSPSRPIPTGAIGPIAAVILGILCLLAAMLASVFLGVGSAVLCALTAITILFFNLTGKFLPAVGIVLVGLMRALNMFIPFPWIAFAWPIWLTMTHVMACYAIVHVLEGKRPRLRDEDWWAICAGWIFWTLTLVTWMNWRYHGSPGAMHGRPWMWIGPMIAVAIFVCIAWLMLRHRMRPIRIRRATGSAFMRFAMLWLIVYDAVWLISRELYGPGLLLMFFFLLAYCVVQLGETLRQLSESSTKYHITSPRQSIEISRH